RTRAIRRDAVRSGWGQTAKNSRKALTSELPPITDTVRREETPFAFRVQPSRCELLLVRSLSGFFLKIIADGRIAMRAPRSPETLPDGRWSAWSELAPASIDGARCGQRPTLLPILAPMHKLRLRDKAQARQDARGRSHVPGVRGDEADWGT